MHVVALLHGYPPHHNAGAEWMLHSLLRHLVGEGWTVTVVLVPARRGRHYEIDGIAVRYADKDQAYRWVEQADICVTHLDATRRAGALCLTTGTPLVHVVHNDRQLAHHKVQSSQAQLVVWNSRWIADAHHDDWADVPQIVVPPPVFADDYRTDRRGDRITLVNLFRPKGSELFWAVAERMQHRRFLAVRGSYGDQHIPSRLPPNVDLLGMTQNMRDDVYAHSRIVLMPSAYESWGRVAVEAAASGIPTIAHPTPGLQEALGWAGIFADRDSPDEWAQLIDRLCDDEDLYRWCSAASRARSDALDPAGDLERWTSALETAAKARA